MNYILELILEGVVKGLILIAGLLIGVAYVTLFERKIMAAMQKRRGPNVVGVLGLLQPFADGVKLIVKETIIPIVANKGIYILAPIITFTISLIVWSIIPMSMGSHLANISNGILFILAVSSLGVYGIILAGWSSNSKYAFLGGLRSAAQMVSYEVSIGLISLSVISYSGSVNLQEIIISQQIIWYAVILFPAFLMFFVSGLAETNRPPFDLPEAEAELVSGYNVEYASTGFVLFFLGEYANIIFMSMLTSILFLGGCIKYSLILSIKVVFVIFSFVWVRATLPRYRYDQLMYLGWKVLLPISLMVYIVGISAVVSISKE